MSDDEAHSPDAGAGAEPFPSDDDFRRLFELLVRRFRNLDADPELASDLAQRTLMEAWESRGSFRGEAQLDTWVVSIGKNVWAEHWRRLGRISRAADEVPLDASAESSKLPRPWSPRTESPEALATQHDLIERAKTLLREMAPERRAALRLWVLGHPYKEIAVLLGVRVSRVSSQIREARMKLRRELFGSTEDSQP